MEARNTRGPTNTSLQARIASRERRTELNAHNMTALPCPVTQPHNPVRVTSCSTVDRDHTSRDSKRWRWRRAATMTSATAMRSRRRCHGSNRARALLHERAAVRTVRQQAGGGIGFLRASHHLRASGGPALRQSQAFRRDGSDGSRGHASGCATQHAHKRGPWWRDGT